MGVNIVVSMKVIQLVSHFDMGGAERIAINIAKSKSGVEYHMVEVIRGHSHFTVEFLKELENAGIKYHRANITHNKIAIAVFPFHFYKILSDIKPDIIQTHTEAADLALYLTHLLFPWKLKSIKIVRTLHNTVLWDSWNRIGKYVEKYMIHHQANVSNSKMIMNLYQERYGTDNNITLIYNGFNPVTQKKYEKLVTGKKNVLFAGRFVNQKGIPSLISVINAVNSDIFHFHVAGKGELEKYLRDNLEGIKNVSITEPIFNLPQYLGSFDFVFIPSIHEGLNSLSIESSLNHTPVIINDIDGLNETVPAGYVLKAKDNSIEDYKRIFQLLETEDAKKFSNWTYSYALKHFSMQKMQNEYEKLYQDKVL